MKIIQGFVRTRVEVVFSNIHLHSSREEVIFSFIFSFSRISLFYVEKTMSFQNEDQHRIFLDEKKEKIIQSQKSLRNGLVRSDRSILRHFFGFNKDGGKDINHSASYVKDCLLSDNDDSEEETDGQSNISRIFPIEEKTKLWEIGKTLSDAEQISVIRTFQTFSRIYSTDLCFKRCKFGSKLLLVGPVIYI